MSGASEDRSSYTYPDPDDAITNRMIVSLSQLDRWAAEEESVLSRLISFIAQLDEPRSLLDVGAGEGRLAARLSPLFRRAVLVEPDEDRARSIARVVGRNDAVFPYRVTSRLEEAAEDAPYSVVLISHVVQHVAFDLASELVERSAALCVRGGIIYLSTNLSRHDHGYHAESVSDAGQLSVQALTREDFDELTRVSAGVLPIHSFPESYLTTILARANVEVIEALPFHQVAAAAVDEKLVCRDIALIGRKT